MRQKTSEERLWAGIPSERTGNTCWTWLGAVDTYGYGKVFYQGRTQKSHRVVYELLAGSIPQGLVIDHLCRNRLCVNPAHMEPVTNVENLRRGNGVGVRNAAKTHCPQGHQYTPENTRWHSRPRGAASRECCICCSERGKRRRRNRSARVLALT